jgi:hypothetical protein
MSMNSIPNSPPPAGSGGPPVDQSLERRLTVLETRFDTMLPTLATKADLEALRVELGIGLERLRGDFRSEMEKLRADVFKALHDTMKWLIGLTGSMFIGLLGANFAMFTVVKTLIENRLPPAPAVHRSGSPVALQLPAPQNIDLLHRIDARGQTRASLLPGDVSWTLR